MRLILENDCLAIELLHGSACTGARFDRTGFVAQVRLKRGGHTFCTSERERLADWTGGAGICGEFGLFTPVGYDGAAQGDPFPKLGVGLLTRLDGSAYDFRASYPVEPYRIRTELGIDYVRYAAEPKDCRGYAAALTKTVRIEGAALSIDYALYNAGSEPIVTEEYTHNFMAVNGNGPGPSCRLNWSIPLAFEAFEREYTPRVVRLAGSEVRFVCPPERDIYFSMAVRNQAELWWELVHEPSGVGVRETCGYPPARIAVWGAPHVVSPEVFVPIRLLPGETQEWRRTYSFFQRGA